MAADLTIFRFDAAGTKLTIEQTIVGGATVYSECQQATVPLP
jgi:hypothetical protein